MMTQSKSNYYLLELFKSATIIHILCLIINLIIHPYITVHNIVNTIIKYSNLVSIICISIIVTIKTIQFFVKHYQHLMSHYKFIGLITEFYVASIVVIIIFFNQEITDEFVLFVASLSKQSHDHKIILLIILLLLIFCIKLHQAHEINKKSIETQSIKNKVYFHLISLILKLFIITGTAIGFTHPTLHFLKPVQLQQFNRLIFRFTTTEFFVYIHTIIVILLGLWTIVGIYYIYKLYQNKRR